MKITFLVNQYARISGGNRALFEYVNRLKDMGHEMRWIVLAKPFKSYRLDKWLASKMKTLQVLPPETIDWLRNTVPIEVIPYNHEKFIPAADILIATAWQTAAYALTLPRDKGEKFYFIQHYESLWARDKENAEHTYNAPLQKMVISTWLKDTLSEKHGQSAEVFVTPVNHEVFHCTEKKWNPRRRVCMLHHDYDWKGYREGIEAVRKVRSQNKEFDLVVFGEKFQDPAPLFEQAGFEFEYHYRPTQNRLRDIYASCDIYLCPSWYEGLGMPAMEAMACRCAVVTTDTGGSRDYAIDNETALVSPPQEVAPLAHNLSRMIDDETLLMRLSEAGHKKITEFNWDDNSRRMIRMLENSLK